jgi:predicted chitinase
MPSRAMCSRRTSPAIACASPETARITASRLVRSARVVTEQQKGRLHARRTDWSSSRALARCVDTALTGCVGTAFTGCVDARTSACRAQGAGARGARRRDRRTADGARPDAARCRACAGRRIGDRCRSKSALGARRSEHVPAADRASAKTAIPAILAAARTTGSSDPNRIAYLLATAQTESDFGAHMTETGHSVAWYNRTYGSDDGNRPGTSDGYAYRGRGYVQATHAGRYAELSHRLGLPDVPALDHGKPVRDECGRQKFEPELVAHPEKLADPALAARALVIGVQKNLFTHNPTAALDATIPAGRRPGDVDFYHARGIVNGIVKDQALAIARHATVYAEILDSYRHSVLGVPAAK